MTTTRSDSAVGQRSRLLLVSGVAPWDWNVNVENLFNRERYFTGSDYSDQIYPGPPINVFTTIRLRLE